MSPDDKQELRSELLSAVAKLSLPLRCRPLDAFHSLDDSLLFVESDLKAAVVTVAEDVDWGSELSSCVEPADDDSRPRPLLFIDVPNTLKARVPEILQALKAWFTT
ncbi:hypothetical protein GCM10022281_08460 [Sphingomonas rosea]|uniref:Uncharacterized protein n=1 Tax=Sphingomonas rosea TaxID=335605 RepID=A0ABP7TU62_9SPHN